MVRGLARQGLLQPITGAKSCGAGSRPAARLPRWIVAACGVSRCAASSIRPSATTVTGFAWREDYEPVLIKERNCAMAPTQPRHDDIIIRRRFGEHASTHTVKQIYA